MGIFPVKYNPSGKYADVLQSAKFTITLNRKENSMIQFGCSIKDAIIEYINGEHYGSEMHFYDSFAGMEWKEKKTDKGKYLVLLPPKYRDAISEFVAYKTIIGFDVETYMVGEDVPNSAQAIRNFLRGKYDEYNDWKYLLLVGNTGDIPHSTGILLDENNPPTDLYYSCLEQPTIEYERYFNLLPEVYVGRWVVYEPQEVINITRKTIKTESALYTANSSQRSVSMFSGRGHHEHIFHRDINLASDILNTAGVPSTPFLGKNNIRKSDMIRELSGVDRTPFAFFYYGHGGTNTLGDPYYLNVYDIENMTSNTPFSPFGFGYTCQTNDYTPYPNYNDRYKRSFGYAFTSLSEKNGGVTYYGSTVTSYANTDSRDLLCTSVRLCHRINFSISETLSWIANRIYGLHFWSQSLRKHIEKYNLLGDPSIRIYGVSLSDGSYGQFAPSNNSMDIEKKILTFAQENVLSIKLYDMTGRLIKESDNSIIDTSDIPSGFYIIETIYSRDQRIVKKIVINH